MKNVIYCDLKFVTLSSGNFLKGNFLKGMCFKGYAHQQCSRS